MVRKITYAGQFYYEDDALSQVFTETGRIVNDDNGRASGSPDGWDGVDYQYMLADHLGNARVVLSSIAERHVTVVATHEGERLTEEAMVFDNLELRDNSQQQYDHTQYNANVTTTTPDYSYIRLDGQVNEAAGINNTLGTMALLQVQAGDEIDLKVYVKYDQGGNDTNVGATGLVAALGNMFGSASSPGEGGSAFNLFDQAAQAMTGFMTGEGGTEPDAYLQYLFFDKDFNFTGTLGDGYDFDKVDADAALSQHDSLSLSRTFTEDGYLFVFISNSSAEIPVYFDDLTIDYTMSPIDQASDYYPFGGLMGSGFERIISKTNNFRYQGKEYDKDLQWYDFHARQYDPYLGRFLAADPLMQFSSPYNGMGNNPMNLIDPTGMGAYNGAHGDPTPETPDDKDKNKHADKDERMISGADALNNFAQFDSWLASMNSNGPSFHSGLYGVGNGSQGSGSHQSYVSSRGQVSQAKKAAQLLGGTYNNGAVSWYSTSGNAYYSNGGNLAGGIMVSEHLMNIAMDGNVKYAQFGGSTVNAVEDQRNVLTGIAISMEGYAFRELSKYPNPLPKPSPHVTVLRQKWLKTLSRRAGQAGLVFSAWEATEKGWTTGATASFAADVAAIGLTVVCPVCGIVYGVTRLAVDVYGYDVADQIDAAVGSEYGAGAVWDSF